MRFLLLAHAILILLAATNYTLVTSIFSGEALQLCYLKFGYENGFGTAFVSEFSRLVTATYFASFAIGLAGYAVATRRGRFASGIIGVMLCSLGAVSFLIEMSHWLMSHQFAWYAFSPLAMLVLAAFCCLPASTKYVESLSVPATENS